MIKGQRDRIQKELKQKDGTQWDYVQSTSQGGTSTSGNVCRHILYNPEMREIFTKGFSKPEEKQAAENFGHDLAIILRIMSSDCKVTQDKFKDSCQNLYIHLLDKMTWMSITPTLHKLFAHAPQLVKHNGGRGLKRLSEEGL